METGSKVTREDCFQGIYGAPIHSEHGDEKQHAWIKTKRHPHRAGEKKVLRGSLKIDASVLPTARGKLDNEFEMVM